MFFYLFALIPRVSSVAFITEAQIHTLYNGFTIENSLFYSIHGSSTLKFNDIGDLSGLTITKCTFSDLSGENEVVFDFSSLVRLELLYNCIDHVTASGWGAIMNTSFRYNVAGDGGNAYQQQIHYLAAFQCEGNGPIIGVHSRANCYFELKHSNLTELENKVSAPGTIKVSNFPYDIFQCTFVGNGAGNGVLFLIDGWELNSVQPQLHQCNFVNNHESGSGIINVEGGIAQISDLAFSGNYGRNIDIYSSAESITIENIYYSGNYIRYESKLNSNAQISAVGNFQTLSMTIVNSFEVCITIPHKTPHITPEYKRWLKRSKHIKMFLF